VFHVDLSSTLRKCFSSR